jgi:hypothetical protein
MAIRFICDRCRLPLNVPDDAAGRLAQCPKCLAVGRVPVETPTLDQASDETDEHPVLPVIPVPDERSDPRPDPVTTYSPFRTGFAWGAGFWIAGLLVVVAARAADWWFGR